MHCNEIRELISSMLDHELSAEDSAIVAEHLADCPECMRAFEAFHAISLSLEELEEVPEGFTEDVMSRIKTANTKKTKSPIKFLRAAGLTAMAACMAVVMMAGTRFANTHMYVGSGNSDTAEFVQIRQVTPTPAPTADVVTFTLDRGEQTDDMNPDTDNAESQSVTDENSLVSTEEETVNVTPAAPANAAPVITPTPIPAVTPTPMPPMDLMFVSDLLIVVEEADFNLFTDFPAYEVTAEDAEGNAVTLLIWADGTRIYCKNEATGTAWYTVGTSAQLAALLGTPLPTPTPVPTVTPDSVTEDISQ